jgi:ATP phosphoribosyltransferase regulatory subunit
MHGLPAGVADLGPAERETVDALMRRMTSIFYGWGYRQVEPPIFEYFETFKAGGAAFSEHRVYRFLDRNGSLLALRPDMTTGIARMVASQLAGALQDDLAEVLPMRLGYAGPVFRSESVGSGLPHAFWQAGVELIGQAGVDADAEVIGVCAAAAAAAGAVAPRVVVGHAGLAWQALSATGPASDERSAAFRAAARQRDLVALEGLLGAPAATILAGGPYVGPAALTALEQLAGLGPDLEGSVASLRALLEALRDHGVEDVALDPSLLRDLDYYTGMVFEVVVPGLGVSLAGGGRYDSLLSRFGAPLPATGFALDLSVASGLSKNGLSCGPGSAVVLAVAGPDERREAVALAATLRAQGLRVETRLQPEPLAVALRMARGRGAERLLYCEGGGYREIKVPAAAPTAGRPLFAVHRSIH